MFIVMPSRITADVRRICRKIGGLEEPRFVEVTAPSAFTAAELDDCFEDVRRQVEQHGGSIQHGWTIWEWPGIFIEGEFHAVWRDPNGDLIDVTPKKDGEKQILFAPDPTRVFSGRRIDNIRLATGRDPRIKELLKIKEDYSRHLGRLTKGVPFGTPFTLDHEAVALQKRAARLEIELIQSRGVQRGVRR